MDSTTGTYIVWGPPGTGKTTYLAGKTREFVEWARRWHPENHTPVLICSLTRAAAAEIGGRDLNIPAQCTGTLHKHAFRALGMPEITEKHIDDWNQTCPTYRLTNQDGSAEPGWDRQRATTGDELSGRYHLLRARMTPRELWPERIKSFASKWEAWKDDIGAIDFSDMIDFAYDTDSAPGDPRIIIADEAQDLSALEFRLLEKWGKAAGRLIVTGDPYQALYVWRGAHPEMFMDPQVPEEHKRVLSQSYRVPRAVHAVAMAWISELSELKEQRAATTLQYRPRDFQGDVLLYNSTWRVPERAVAAAEDYLKAGKSVMFAASCSFFLYPLVKVLRQRGIPFSNPWATRRGDWNPLRPRRNAVTMAERVVDYLRCDRCGAWTFAEMDNWVNSLKSKDLLEYGAKKEIRALAAEYPDEIVTEYQLGEWLQPDAWSELAGLLVNRENGSTTEAELLAWWSSRLNTTKIKPARFPLAVAIHKGAELLTKEPRLYVGTIHSFKGSEADVVFVFPDLSPAGAREWATRGEPRDSVVRLFYVAMTRAREQLVLCMPGGGSAVDFPKGG